MANMPATAELYKRRYCHGDNSQCARFMILKNLGKEKMPNDLFPNQLERAKLLIEQEGKEKPTA